MKKYYFTLLYIAFVIAVIGTNWHEKLFDFSQKMALGKVLILLIWLSFSILTIKYSIEENFFKSLKKITAFRWGRQIGLDLWVGQTLALIIVYWFTGSFLTVLLWLIPFIVFGNLATLLFFFMNYDALVGQIISNL
jgi:hypothetical protein